MSCHWEVAVLGLYLFSMLRFSKYLEVSKYLGLAPYPTTAQLFQCCGSFVSTSQTRIPPLCFPACVRLCLSV